MRAICLLLRTALLLPANAMAECTSFSMANCDVVFRDLQRIDAGDFARRIQIPAQTGLVTMGLLAEKGTTPLSAATSS